MSAKLKRKDRRRKKRSFGAKVLRFFLFLFLSLFLLIVAAAFIIPTFFKDEIGDLIKKEIHAQVNATAYFDPEDFSLSLFKHFPNATADMKSFGLVGKDEFEGDTLVSVGSFEVEINLMSLFSDKYKINGVYLREPIMKALVNEDGNANWDIYIGATDTVPVDTAVAAFNLEVNEWEITDGKVIYRDIPGDMYAEIVGLNHSGSGNFNEKAFDLNTNSSIEKLTYEMGGIPYLSNNKLSMEMNLGISENYSKYHFNENTITLNDFSMGFDGDIQLSGDDILIENVTFEAKETDFKNILSLVPGVFTKDFDDLKTSGTLAFNGKVDGKYNENKMPGFNVNLLVKKGMFQYPELPSKVSDVNIDFNTKSSGGDLEDIQINLKNLSLMMGKNPIKAKATVVGLSDMQIDGWTNAKVDLADMMRIYPIEDVTLKGLFTLDATAKGRYNESGAIPAVNANMSMADGYIKTAYFEKPIEQLEFSSNLDLPSTDLSQGTFKLSKFNMMLDGDPFGAKAIVKDFEAINFDFSANGLVDLSKLMAMYPIEGMTLKGKFLIENLNAAGNMKAVEEERYGDIQTSGKMRITEFLYADSTLMPGPFTIDEGDVSFTPRDIVINYSSGKISKSDYNASGTFSNYMGYMFSSTDTVIRGDLKFNSKYFDVNEWMYEEATPPTVDPANDPVAPAEVYPLPKNMHLVADTKIDFVDYDNMDLEGLTGNVVMKNGVLYVNNGRFTMFGGQFITDGFYSTENPKVPAFKFKVNIDNMKIQNAYTAFATFKRFIPNADKVEGAFSSNFIIGSQLGQDYMPLYNTLTMDGLFDIHSAKAKDVKLLKALNKLTNLNEPNDLTIANTKLKASIKDGFLEFDPFSFDVGKLDMKIEGKNGLTGAIDYVINTKLPGGSMTQALNNKLTSLGLPAAGDKIDLKIGVGGTITDPKPRILGAGGIEAPKPKEVVKAVVVDKACDNLKPRIDKIQLEAQQKAQQLRDAATKTKDKIVSEGKAAADKIRDAGKSTGKSLRDKGDDEAKQVIKDAGINPLKRAEAETKAAGIRKLADKAADKAESEANEKANSVEKEAISRGQSVEDKANEEANDIIEQSNKKVAELTKDC